MSLKLFFASARPHRVHQRNCCRGVNYSSYLKLNSIQAHLKLNSIPAHLKTTNIKKVLLMTDFGYLIQNFRVRG